MKRVIKFRGKSYQSDEWCYGSLVDYGEELEIQGFDVFHEGKDSWKEIQVIPATVGQFTGLYDANGKEIYEGDIIQFIEDDNGLKSYAVEYDCAQFSPIFVLAVSKIVVNRRIEETEVIGNIHDNPELLKGGGQ